MADTGIQNPHLPLASRPEMKKVGAFELVDVIEGRPGILASRLHDQPRPNKRGTRASVGAHEKRVAYSAISQLRVIVSIVLFPDPGREYLRSIALWCTQRSLSSALSSIPSRCLPDTSIVGHTNYSLQTLFLASILGRIFFIQAQLNGSFLIVSAVQF